MVKFVMSSSHLHESFSHDEVIGLLLIGAGKMGRAHAAAFASVDGVEIVGIASRGGESAARLAMELGVGRWSKDWCELADETKPHACVIAVSHLLNEAVTTEVIDRGLHVLSEKPVAFHSEAIRTIAARAEDKGVVAMAAMNRRFYPSVVTAIDMVRFYGTVQGVTVVAPDPVRAFRATRKHDPKVYDSWFRANTLHAIDLLRLVGGEVQTISGDAHFNESVGERSIVATIRFCSGTLGCFIAHSGAGGPWAWELRIHGDGVEASVTPLEKGSIRIDGMSPRPLPSSLDPDGLKPGLRAQALAFIELIRSGGASVPPVSDLNDHARTMELAESLEGLCNGKSAKEDS